MKLVEQRISDRRILKLIKQWLVSGVLYGNVLTISELGTSQGSVISPLLANIYLNTLDRLWEKYGLTHGILVRYADDTVIICKNKKMSNRRLSQVISADYIRWKYLSQSAVNEVKAFYIGWHRRLSRAYFSSAMAGLK